MTDQVYKVAQHNGANAAALILIGGYGAIVLYNGNLGALLTQLKQDFLGTNGQGAFWRWGLALLILYALAKNPSTNHLFGPILVIAIVAMLIEAASRSNGGASSFFKSLHDLFTGPAQSSVPSMGTIPFPQ